MTTPPERRHNFPLHYRLQGATIIFRPLTSECRGAILGFARNLPEEDLLFLDRDITQQSVVDQWIKDISEENLVTVVAWQDGAIVGYATTYGGNARWTRHVAALCVVVAESVRGIGLGGLLLELVFEIALEEGATKLVAHMTPNQTAALKLFQRLGFAEEAVLRENAMDANGLTHDLMVLSFHTRQNLDSRCGLCGVPVLTALTLEGVRLCSSCYESQYAELGGGD